MCSRRPEYEFGEPALSSTPLYLVRFGFRAGENLYQSSLRACTAVLSELKKEEESRDYAERKIKALLGIAISSFDTDSMESKVGRFKTEFSFASRAACGLTIANDCTHFFHCPDCVHRVH